MTLWQIILYWLAWLSADPVEIDAIHARAAAAATLARASLLTEAPQPKPPAPTECVCGETCKKGIWKPDGRVEQKCECTCERCRRERSTPPSVTPSAPRTIPSNCPNGVCPKIPASGNSANR